MTTSSERPWKKISFLVLEEAGVTERDGLVRVPYRLPDGTEHNAKLFDRQGRRWYETRDLEQIPLGLETLPASPLAESWAVIVAEGESDCLALREAFAGTTVGHSISGFSVLGLPGASTWRPEWRLYVEQFPLIYVIGDGDRAGRGMIEDVYGDLPWSRPVWLPEGADARTILQAHGPRALDVLLERADEVARFVVAFQVAANYPEFVALLKGQGVGGGA